MMHKSQIARRLVRIARESLGIGTEERLLRDAFEDTTNPQNFSDLMSAHGYAGDDTYELWQLCREGKHREAATRIALEE